jgi:hypothetical protein
LKDEAGTFVVFLPGTEVVCLAPQKGEILGGVVQEQFTNGSIKVTFN